LVTIGSLNFNQQLWLTPNKLIMSEAPEVGSLSLQPGVNLYRIRILDLAESVKIELTHERAKFGVLEKLRNNGLFEHICVLYDEGFSVI